MFGKLFVSYYGIECCFYGGEILIKIFVQLIGLRNSLVYCGVIGGGGQLCIAFFRGLQNCKIGYLCLLIVIQQVVYLSCGIDGILTVFCDSSDGVNGGNGLPW